MYSIFEKIQSFILNDNSNKRKSNESIEILRHNNQNLIVDANNIEEISSIKCSIGSFQLGHESNNSFTEEVKRSKTLEFEESQCNIISKFYLSLCYYAMKFFGYKNMQLTVEESENCSNSNMHIENNSIDDITDKFSELCTKVYLPKITEDMKVLVSNTLLRDKWDDVVAEGFNLCITVTDLFSLQPEQWLTDNIINFYLELINFRNSNNVKYPKLQILSSFFYPKLLSAGYDGVKRWTKRRPIFSSELVLVPIHLGNHWCLVTINVVRKQVFYYDSLKVDNPAIISNFRLFLAADFKDKLNEDLRLEEWVFEQKMDGPRQTNGSDCGVFVCQTAECASRNSPVNFSQAQMDYFREKMSYEVVVGSLCY